MKNKKKQPKIRNFYYQFQWDLISIYIIFFLQIKLGEITLLECPWIQA